MATTSIPKTMKGLQIREFQKPYHFTTDIPVPELKGDNEILVKIAVAGYCHSEVPVQNGNPEVRWLMAMHDQTLPIIPSHEGAGVVVAVGSGVTNFKVGDRVGSLAVRNPCGSCPDCMEGLPKFCDHVLRSGVDSNGAGAEYMVVDGNWTVSLPHNLSFEAAAPLMCAGATIYSALKVANLKSGQTVAIIGAGALGHLGIQFAKCMGLRVVSVDARQAPLDLVKSLKYAPDYTIDATKGVEYALKEIGGHGVDATLVATDSIPAHEYGLNLTRKHGTVVVIGLPVNPIPIHYRHLIFRDITIKGSMLSDAQTAQEMVDLVAEKGIEVKTRAYPLEDVETLIKDFNNESHAGKLVMRVSQDQ